MDNENVLMVSDLMLNAVEENPVSFKDTFDQLLMQRIEDKIEAAKTEVAQNYFAGQQEADEQTDEESAEEQSDEQVEDENGEDTETV